MSTAKKLLIVDDDDALRDALKDQFSLHDEFTVTDHADQNRTFETGRLFRWRDRRLGHRGAAANAEGGIYRW